MRKYGDVIDYITDNEVNQGDLCFIFHKKKPYKSGWWRKVRVKHGDFGVEYVLEVPVHADYYTEDGSKMIDGYYVMGRENFKKSVSNREGKYEILCVIKGVDSVEASRWMHKHNTPFPCHDTLSRSLHKIEMMRVVGGITDCYDELARNIKKGR